MILIPILTVAHINREAPNLRDSIILMFQMQGLRAELFKRDAQVLFNSYRSTYGTDFDNSEIASPEMSLPKGAWAPQ